MNCCCLESWRISFVVTGLINSRRRKGQRATHRHDCNLPLHLYPRAPGVPSPLALILFCLLRIIGGWGHSSGFKGRFVGDIPLVFRVIDIGDIPLVFRGVSPFLYINGHTLSPCPTHRTSTHKQGKTEKAPPGLPGKGNHCRSAGTVSVDRRDDFSCRGHSC